jgi:transcriptional regulator with XRE-family HTH domain
MKDYDSGARIRSLFGKNLKRLRKQSNISQVNLASTADLAHNFINDIESGKKWVSADTMQKLAAALKVEPHQFFISDSNLDNREAEIISHYLDDFSDSVVKMAKDYHHRYFRDSKKYGEEEDRKKY